MNLLFTKRILVLHQHQSRRGWIGASLVADKDIVISNGSLNYGRQVAVATEMLELTNPFRNRLGKEYVFVRGNGNSNGWTDSFNHSDKNNTQIFVNGSTTPVPTLNDGDFFEILVVIIFLRWSEYYIKPLKMFAYQ